MMQPIDYVSGFGQNPMAGFASALEAGQRFGMMEQQQAALRAREQMAQQEAAFKLQQQQAASLRQQQIAEAVARLQANPNRTFADYEAVGSLVFDPKQQESLRANFEAFNKDRQQQELVFTGQALSSLAGGQPEIAAQLIRERAAGLRNRGEESQANALEALARATEINPAGAEITLAGMLTALPGGDKIIEGVGKAREQRRQETLGPAALEAERRKGMPASILEAIEYEKLTPSQQQIFRNTQTLRQPVTRVEISNIERGSAAELAKLVPDLYTQANAAAAQVADLPRYRQKLQSAITGPLADQRLAVARVATALGFTGDKAVTATTELIQGNAEMALKARSLLTGQGPITEFEQKLLMKAKAADINFTKPELEALFNVFERAAKAQYNSSRRLLESAAKKSETAQMFLDNVSPLPQTTPTQAPAGDVRSRADAIIRGVR